MIDERYNNLKIEYKILVPMPQTGHFMFYIPLRIASYDLQDYVYNHIKPDIFSDNVFWEVMIQCWEIYKI